MNPFWRGLIIGFSIAAPVGPIGVLCVRRSISDGRWIGFATGLGAATADATYGAVAAFSLTTVSDFLVGQRFWFGVIGGVFLCWLGGRVFFSRVAVESRSAGTTSAVAAFASTLLLTLTNPMTILSFAAVFAGFGLGTAPDFGRAGVLVAGVFVGSAVWWLVLSTSAGLGRSRVTPGVMRGINRISGAVIFGFGVYALGAVVAGN